MRKYKGFTIQENTLKSQFWGVWRDGILYYIGSTEQECMEAIDSGACDLCDLMCK